MSLWNSAPLALSALSTAGIVFLTGTLLALAFMVLHSAIRNRHDRLREARLRKGRLILLAGVLGERPVGSVVEAMADVPTREQIHLFVHVGRTLSGGERGRLHELADGLGLVAHAESACRSHAWWRRLHAVRLLGLVGGGDEVVRRLLDDPSRDVRREATRWVADRATDDDVDELLRRAEDPRFVDPITLIDALHRAGAAAVVPIAKRLEAGGRNVLPVLVAAGGIADPRFTPALMRLVQDARHDVRREALRVLAMLATGEAHDALLAALRDPHPTVRRAALEGLAQGLDWRHAPAVAALLEDPDRRVRHEAALALRRLGSPGIVLLRAASRSVHPNVQRVARHVLDLPDTLDFGGTS